MAATLTIRPARPADVPRLQTLINAFAERDLMLPRTQGELYETVRDFLVACEADEILGCAAVHVVTGRIAELKSLAVSDAAQGRGVGRSLVERCCVQAAELGLERVFCLTYQDEFFRRLGFVKVDRARLPEKVWGECVRCPHFLDCHEVAMWRSVTAE